MTEKENCPPENQSGKTARSVVIPIHVQTDELDLAVSKAKKLSEILMEAKALARELASIEVGLELDI